MSLVSKTPLDAVGSAQVFADLQTAPPMLRPGIVLRRPLVERLVAADSDLVAISAPAGYGKTTLLTQVAEATAGPTAWLNLGRWDDDTATLVPHAATAFQRAGLLSARGRASLESGRPSALTRDVAVLAWEVEELADHATFIVDQAEVLSRRDAIDVLGELIARLQGRVRFIVASRASAPLPLSALRPSGRALELTEADLAMSQAEAIELLAHQGVAAEAAGPIIEMCEGWPVALYLTALALRQGGGVWSGGGDNRFMADYLADQVVRSMPRSHYDFLVGTSILDQLSAPLCNAVLGMTDADRLLKGLEASTHLVHAVDPAREWYRSNRVFRAALAAELQRTAAESVAEKHQRAAAWYEDRDMPQPAIHHAQMAGDVEQFARLLRRLMRTHYTTGGAAQVWEWMAWLETVTPLSDYPDIAAMGSLIHLLEGSGLEAERWLALASAGTSAGDIPPTVLVVRALGARGGVGGLLVDARSARAAMEPGSSWLPAAILVEGLGNMWSGDAEAADPLFAEAVTLGERSESYLAVTVALAQRALVAIGRGDWERAAELVQRSLTWIAEHGLDGYTISALPLVVSARVARHGGDIPEATRLLAAAERFRPNLNSANPGFAVQVALEMARAHVELSNIVGARAVLRDAGDVLAQRPDLGDLPRQFEHIKDSLRDLGPGTVGSAALTRAELRLLPLLATHLTFPEIGERLYISRHTVKTQAMSIYRKLGTSSRSEAIAKALETGMLAR